MKTTATEFNNPAAAFRGKPFWAWNAKLEENELRRQIRVFKQMGLGGFFMHARIGLNTPYLSQEWFQLIKGCIDEAQKNGTEAWLYDEDRWPSGAAGGLVTKNPKYRSAVLVLKRYSNKATFAWPQHGRTAYIFAAKFNDADELISYFQVPSPYQIPPEGHHILEFSLTNPPESSWFNDTTYLDTLSKEAVSEFIRVTHERYREEVGEHFGKTIPGIFTDEPNHTGVFRNILGLGKALPWTHEFAAEFQKLFGYDIIAKLPEVAFDFANKTYSQPRYHYHQCKTKMFADAFSGLIGQWCEKNNMLLTGHVLEENPVSSNVSMVGGPMQFYTHMQAPGIDLLTQYQMEYLSVKQCASIAHQMGRKWVLSELYGCTGWETTFETYKHSGDWQAVLGINLRCQHLAFYSMAGEAKRDYPASIHFQSPWWKQYKYVEDYFSRVNVAMTTGSPIANLAVIHPVESYYLLCNYNWTPDIKDSHNPITDQVIKDYDEKIEQLIKWLLGGHIDFDFVDEAVAVDLKASAGKDEFGSFLQVGQMKYRAVLVPPMITMRQTTVTLLKQFEQQGGTIIFAGDAPSHVDAVPSDQPAAFASGKTIAFQQAPIVKAFENAARCLYITDSQGKELADIFYQLRCDDGNWLLFMNNNSREKAHPSVHVKLRVAIPPRSILQRWDLTTGDRFEYPGRVDLHAVECDIDFPPSGSALIVVAPSEEPLPAYPLYHPVGQSTAINPAKWDYILDDHNVFMLDRADVVAKSAGKPVFKQKQQEILRIDSDLREHLGIRPRGGHMVQPWAAKDQPLGTVADIALDYSFNVRAVPVGPVLLAIEQPQRWTITLNDQPIDTDMITGWWVDKAIQTIPVDPNCFVKGKNTLRLQGTFDRLCDLEIVYFLGQFGVKLEGKKASMTKLPVKLDLGDWTQQGLPFYSSAVTYQTTFDYQPDTSPSVLMTLPQCRATVMEISINESKPQVVAFPDYSLEIANLLKKGKNTLSVKVISSRRNAFGPFHLTKDDELWTGPGSFRYNPEDWQDDIRIHSYGLMAAPVLQPQNTKA